MGISDAVRKRIVELCGNKGITVNKLSYFSGVSRKTVGSFMTGATKSIGIENLKKLIDGLDMSITEFFDTEVFRNLEQEIV
ncbi:MAG: helix-turn-helix domain-containing protein [Oscillospiraceae bacterium]|nr:helix-turn-helix domain-containing protein [Oscillospiraceae bacterium]